MIVEPDSGGGFPPPNARAVVFDVVGTLVEPATPVAATYAAAGRRHGLDLDEVTVAGRFRDAWRRQEAVDAAACPAFVTSPERERARWRAIVDDVFGAGEAAAAAFIDLWDHYATAPAWRATPVAAQLVRAVRSAGLPIALASNFDDRLLVIAPLLDPLCHAGHVFTSADIGWRKPAGEFFRTLERRLGRSPAELLFVGDDPDLDIAAAAHAGWQTWRVG